MSATELTNMTSAERNLGRRWFEQVWNKRRREAIGELFPPYGVAHDGDLSSTGPQAFYDFFDRMTAIFSDIHIDVHDDFAENDRLCLRWKCDARHTGPGLGVPPTNRLTHVTGISIMRIEGGHIVEAWQNWDMLGLMQQVGILAPSVTYIAETQEKVATP